MMELFPIHVYITDTMKRNITQKYLIFISKIK